MTAFVVVAITATAVIVSASIVATVVVSTTGFVALVMVSSKVDSCDERQPLICPSENGNANSKS
jgi:hypothetical protein